MKAMIKKQKTKTNPGERGEYELQSYHISRFRCPYFDQKSQDIKNKQENIAHSKEKNK